MKPTVNFDSSEIVSGPHVKAHVFSAVHAALSSPDFEWNHPRSFDAVVDRAFGYVLNALVHCDPWYIFSIDTETCFKCCHEKYLVPFGRPGEIGDPWLLTDQLSAVLALMPAVARQVYLCSDNSRINETGEWATVFDNLYESIYKFRLDGPDGAPPQDVEPCGH